MNTTKLQELITLQAGSWDMMLKFIMMHRTYIHMSILSVWYPPPQKSTFSMKALCFTVFLC